MAQTNKAYVHSRSYLLPPGVTYFCYQGMHGGELFWVRHECTEELDVSVLFSLHEVQLCFRSLQQLLPAASTCWLCIDMP